MRMTYLWIFLIFFQYLGAQVEDNFDDGDISTNPVWFGDLAHFNVDASGKLHLNAPEAGHSYIYLPVNIPDSFELSIDIVLDFSPSNANRAKIFFALDSTDPSLASGYQILIGENGNNDAVTFGKLINGSFFPLAKGKSGAIANEPSVVRISLIFRPKDQFKVKLDYDLNGIYEDFFSFSDQVPDVDSITYFGIDCLYSETRKDKFSFDNLFLGLPVVDSIPPLIQSVTAIDDHQIHLKFSEPLDLFNAQRLSNFGNDILGFPMKAQLDSITLSSVILTYNLPFISGQNYALNINHVTDLRGNVVNDTTVYFSFIGFPQQGDLAISEILFDPYPNRYDFIELYNRTEHPLLLQNCSIKNASNNQEKTILSRLIIQAHDYIALTADSSSTVDLYLAKNPKTVRSQDLPAFNNDKGQLVFYNGKKEILDSFHYNTSYHLMINDDKSVEGVSLEKIDLLPFSNGRDNWLSAAKSFYYASPGYTNSHRSDTLPPHLLEWKVVHDDALLLVFDDAMNKQSIERTTNYYGIEVRESGFNDQIINEVVLKFSKNLENTKDYELTIQGLSDKNGNVINDTTIIIRTGDLPSVGELVISEILFNPNSKGVDFIELYNPSDKRIQLQGISIHNKDNGQKYTIESDFVLLPGRQVAITTDEQVQRNQYVVPDSALFLINNLPALNADKGIVEIYTVGGELLDSFTYDENFHVLLIDKEDVKGVSLEKLQLLPFTNDHNNWHSSAKAFHYATPGFKNANRIEKSTANDGFSLHKKIFSPNSDGIDDLLVMEYNLETSGYVANIEIYNSEGYLVKNLSKNELLGTKGYVTWDGTNNNGAIERLGIYILIGNIYNTSGQLIAFKKDCVLADYIH